MFRTALKPRVKSSGFQVKYSLFRKYLLFGLIILLVSFISLGVMMYIFVSSYWEREQKNNLVATAQRVVDKIESSNERLSLFSVTTGQTNLFEKPLPFMSGDVGSDILLVDRTGTCIDCTEGDGCIHRRRALPSYALGEAADGEFFETGTLEGYYDENYYIAGVPIFSGAGDDAEIEGYCYVFAKATFTSALPKQFVKIFLISAGITLVIVILFVAMTSYQMAQPLKQMSNAAKRFAVGDFSVRVNVKSADEIGELANAFNHMADSLSASEGMRRTFISNVSHELKTPMTSIAGFIDGILDGTIPPEQQKHYMNIVSNEVKRLSRLVTSMLSLSRIDNGELKIHPATFDLFSTLISILAGFEQNIIEKNLRITGLERFRAIRVYADPDLMYQVIYNLIENAVKFTPEGGYIDFNIEETRFDITVMITNSGEGIAPEDIRFVFDRFYKTDKSRSMDKKGMGLGLFIAKTIMRLHEGDIYVESRVGEFKRFAFRLPTNIPHQKTSKKDSGGKYIETTIEPETEE